MNTPTRARAEKGVKANRTKARQHARAIYAQLLRLQSKEGLTALAALTARLEELSCTGARGGRTTRERLSEIRQPCTASNRE
jgi:hypothetical protein